MLSTLKKIWTCGKCIKMVKKFTKSSTKRNTDRVYIELSQGPHSSQDYQERGNEILSKMYDMFCMDHENKENPQIFVTCPVCFMLSSYDSEIIEREGICCLAM